MKIKGIYLMGSFRKGKKALSYFDIKKPFEFDKLRGEVNAVPFHFWKDTIWFDEWEYIEGYNLKGDKDKLFCDICNETWKDWCKKYKRKYKPIMKESKERSY